VQLTGFGKFQRLFNFFLKFYSNDMPKTLHNWTYRDVTGFLRRNGFSFFQELDGAQQSWIKLEENGEPDRIVEVSFTSHAYSPKTLKKMIRQSGIDKDTWIKWAGS
jgi:hypothetical protein